VALAVPAPSDEELRQHEAMLDLIHRRAVDRWFGGPIRQQKAPTVSR